MFIVRKQPEKINILPIRSATANELLRYEESANGEYANTITDIKDTLAKYLQRIESLENASQETVATAAKIAYINLLADAWQGDKTPYSQVVEIDGITANSQVDLMLNVEQLSIFWNKNLGFVTENINGIVTVYAIGQKPTNDYTFQVAITEVVR